MADPDVRASDDDRERTAEQLRGAAAQGRISVDELEERLQAAYGARTQGELVPIVADLPAAVEHPAGRLPVRRGEGGSRWLISVLGGHERQGHWRPPPRPALVQGIGGNDPHPPPAQLA